jgi:NitT/TauT family transport system permease protein
LENTCAAIAISIVLGFALGAVIQRLRRLRRIVSPLLAAYYAVPAFVFYPLLVVLIGLNRFSLIAIGATLGVVGMIVNTIDGLDRVPRVFKQTAASFRMGRIATLLLIDVPAAAPYLVTGVKLAVTYSITGTIAGEFILSVAGLGRAMSLAYNNLDNATMYGLLLLLLAASTVANLGIHAWEQRMYRRWGHS